MLYLYAVAGAVTLKAARDAEHSETPPHELLKVIGFLYEMTVIPTYRPSYVLEC